MARPAFLVLDLETFVDGELVARLRYAGEAIPPSEAVARYRKELLDASGGKSDFVPHTFHVPATVCVAKVSADLALEDVVILDEPELRPHVMVEKFWRGWEHYGHPTLVTFNGRGFDLPVLELAAFRYGIAIRDWMEAGVRGAPSPRGRYNTGAHLDLMEAMTNHGAARFSGGLDLLATLVGKPGKMDVEGRMVQDLWERGERARVAGYCRCDVLDTYFVFLRTRVMAGTLALEKERALVAEAKAWIGARADAEPAYRRYLDHWGDWVSPWEAPPALQAP